MTVMATKKDYDDFAVQLAAIGRPIVVGFEAGKLPSHAGGASAELLERIADQMPQYTISSGRF